MAGSIIGVIFGQLGARINDMPTIFIALFSVYFVGNMVYNLVWSPLAKFPGPKMAAVSMIPMLYWTVTGQLSMKIHELHNKYGDVIRMGPTTLIYRSAQAWRDINTPRNFLKDSSFYIESPLGPSIIDGDEEAHTRFRSLMGNGFSGKTLREQESLIHHYVDLLVDCLNTEISTFKNPVDLCRWHNFTTFDIIGDLVWGDSFGCLKEKEYHFWITNLFLSVKSVIVFRPLTIYPLLAPFLEMLLPQKVKALAKDHTDLSSQKLQSRLDKTTDRPDLITSILGKSNEAQTQANTISQRELASNCALLIVAGSETSASLLSGLTYYMLKNPPAYEKLKKEIRESFQSYNDINFQAVSTLPYLNAVIEEALRCYPPVSGIQPRIVPKGGAMIDGEMVPEGTSVSGAHYSTYHAASHFTEPDSFIPERWLETRDKRFESDNRSAMVPFSLGPRNCIGRNLGYAEMRLIVAKMTWSFDMTLDMSSDKWNVQKSFGFWQKPPLLVHLTKHNAKA